MASQGERLYTVGTAGHVDHGKSSLIRALTGVNPDHLPEELARGMTIDLGFVHYDLGDEVKTTFIDVPGHERFVRTAIAGVQRVDAVLFVIAADEGIMPQTREHKEVLKYLGCRYGVVALTKRDLVDEDWLGLVRSEVEAFFEGSFLENAPVVAVSSATGEGLEELKSQLRRVLLMVPPRAAGGAFRMPIDRVFTIKGFGTVVAGTVAAGTVRVKDEVEIQPLGMRVRVRGIQSRYSKVEAAGPGARAALNVVGVDAEVVQRGYEISQPGLLVPTRRLDVRLEVAAEGVSHRERVRFNKGTAEVMGRLLLLDGDEGAPGEVHYGQIVLEEPVVGVRFEPFVIRHASSLRLIGGGKIINIHPTPHRRQPWVVAELEAMAAAEGNPEKLIRALFSQRRGARRAYSFKDLLEITLLEQGELEAALQALTREGLAASLGSDYLPAEGVAALAEDAVAVVAAALEKDPLRDAVGREEIRAKLGFALSPDGCAALLERLVKEGRLEPAAGGYRPPGARAELTPAQRQALEALEALFLESPPLRNQDEVEQRMAAYPEGMTILKYALARARLVLLPEMIITTPAYLEERKRELIAHLGAGGTIRAADYKELTGLSRKLATALLDYFYEQGVTVREAGTHRLGPRYANAEKG